MMGLLFAKENLFAGSARSIFISNSPIALDGRRISTSIKLYSPKRGKAPAIVILD